MRNVSNVSRAHVPPASNQRQRTILRLDRERKTRLEAQLKRGDSITAQRLDRHRVQRLRTQLQHGGAEPIETGIRMLLKAQLKRIVPLNNIPTEETPLIVEPPADTEATPQDSREFGINCSLLT
jgi:hypothetical protein